MLTPQFTASQTDDAVLLTIKTPYVKATDIEFFIQGPEFKLHINPYFLRLTFPHELIENGKETAKYDVGKGEIYLSLPKKEPGLHFEDLDLLSKLMMPKAHVAAGIVGGGSGVNKAAGLKGPLIEEMGGTEEDAEDMEQDGDEDEGDFDWEIPQELPEPDLISGVKYGFNNSYSGFSAHVAELGRDIIDIAAIDQSTPVSRRAERIQKEDEKFDEDYYMSDFMNDEDIKRILKFKPEFWASLKKIQQARAAGTSSSAKAEGKKPLIMEVPVVETKPDDGPQTMNMISASGNIDMESVAKEHAEILAEMIQNGSASSATVSEPTWKLDESLLPNQPAPKPSAEDDDWLNFTATEQQEMISLPHRKLLLEPSSSKPLYLGLVDIIFAYCYDHRSMEGDTTVESAWTIAKLSPTLSCFETFSTLNETLVACTRRVLSYPLYRHWGLCMKVKDDVAILFKLGKRALLKVMLAVRRLMRGDDACFVFDRLYIEDYCLWLQSDWVSDKVVKELGSEIQHLAVTKESIGWDLEALEELAKEIGNDEEEMMEG
ncbi:Hsp90 cochaperone shq1 [Rhizoclosmatium sp. JEL0117]|nr:Hsp90 cochaperone shq1 [Rhizoclosmatium sp. JEL0117]